MDYSFDEELPSTSSALPNSPGAQTGSDALSKGDRTDQFSSMNLTEQPSSIEIRNKVEELVERINASRSSDQNEMESYQKKLSDEMSEIWQQLKDHLHLVYEDNSTKIEEKLTELSGILSNCDQLCQELHEATQALSNLRDTF